MLPAHSPRSPHGEAPRPAVPPPHEGSELSAADILRTLRQEWHVIVAVFAAVLFVAVLYTYTRDRVYETSSVVMVEVRSGSGFGPSAGEGLLALGVGSRNLNNELALLGESVPLAERVAERLLREHAGGPLTRPGEGGAAPSPAGVARRMLGERRVQFGPVTPQADLIRIVARSTDPAEATAIANLYAEEYARRGQELSRASVVSSRAFLEEQAAKRGDELAEVEGALEAFLAREGAIALEAETQQAISQLAALDAAADEAEVTLAEERDVLASLEAELARVRPGLPQRLASGVEAEMEAIQAQIAQYELQAATFYAVNPGLRGNEAAEPQLLTLTARLAELRRRLEALSAQYLAEVQAVGGVDVGGGATGLPYVTQLQRDVVQRRIAVQGLEARRAAVRRQLGAYERRLQDIPRQSIQLAQLERRRQAISEMYLHLVNRLQEAQIAEESQLGYVEVVRQADPPGAPVRPRTLLNLLAGVLFGLASGLAAAFLRRAVDHRVRTPDDLRHHGFAVLATTPDMDPLIARNFGGKPTVALGGREVSSTVAAALHPLSPAAEAFRHLRTSLRFSRPDAPIRVLMVTSSAPSEGKSTHAVSLALSMAQAGLRVLLVDADLRKPAVHQRLGLPRDRGLTELLFKDGPADWEAYRYPLEAKWGDFEDVVDSLYVVTAGKRVPNPAELLGSNRFRERLYEMRDAFDIVLVDAPPALAVTDPLLVAQHTDGVVLLAVARKSSWKALANARELVATSGAPLLGVVLNRFEGSPREGYGYGYGYGASATFAASGDGSLHHPAPPVPR